MRRSLFKKPGFLLLGFILALFVVFSRPVLALTLEDTPSNNTTSLEATPSRQVETQQLQVTDTVPDNWQDRIQVQSEVAQTKREALQATMQERQQAMADHLQSMVQNRQALRSQYREMLQAHLAQIQDEQKQQLVLRLDDRFNALQQKWVTLLSAYLTRLDAILTKLESRIALADAAGLDVSQTVEPLTEAKLSLSEAQTALEQWADSSYTIDVSGDETLLYDEVAVVKTALHDDASSVRDAVLNVKASIFNLLQVVRTLDGIENIDVVEP